MIQGILDHGYDGNEGWATFGVFACVLIVVLWRRARALRKDGKPVEWGHVAIVALMLGGFVALSLMQILSHPGAWGTS